MQGRGDCIVYRTAARLQITNRARVELLQRRYQVVAKDRRIFIALHPYLDIVDEHIAAGNFDFEKQILHFAVIGRLGHSVNGNDFIELLPPALKLGGFPVSPLAGARRN